MQKQFGKLKALSVEGIMNEILFSAFLRYKIFLTIKNFIYLRCTTKYFDICVYYAIKITIKLLTYLSHNIYSLLLCVQSEH